jgi:hypothetical protein
MMIIVGRRQRFPGWLQGLDELDQASATVLDVDQLLSPQYVQGGIVMLSWTERVQNSGRFPGPFFTGVLA